MEKRKMWTDKDINYLYQNYETLGKACAVILGRTEQAVFAKASKLGLKSKAKKPNTAKTNEEYDEELLKLNVAFYRAEDYINSKIAILHECFEGHQWSATPTHILNSKSGCPICAGNKKKSTEEYQSLINFEVLEPYINKETPILHRCSEAHEWKARPGHILNSKSGCPYCATFGFDKLKPAILYYVKIIKNNEIYYKIGITNRSVKERFKADNDKQIVILDEIHFATGGEAEEQEKLILKQFEKDRQNITGFLKSGNTELFEYDILKKDI